MCIKSAMPPTPPNHNALREHFRLTQWLPEPLPPEPFPMLKEWFDEAKTKKVQPNPDAMTLATVDADGQPQARIVLCRGVNVEQGSIRFYTNYTSAKGRAISNTGKAAVVFHWDALDRQVRLEGVVVRAPIAESDAYFAKRPWEKKIGAWSSMQSQPLESREEMLDRVEAVVEKLGLSPDELLERGNELNIPRPEHWGGYDIFTNRVELWLGGTGRVHDRAVWTRALVCGQDAMCATEWMATRLQP